MARKMNIWPRTVEETASYKIVQDMPRDYAVYVGGRYVGSRATYQEAYTLAIQESTHAAEAE